MYIDFQSASCFVVNRHLHSMCVSLLWQSRQTIILSPQIVHKHPSMNVIKFQNLTFNQTSICYLFFNSSRLVFSPRLLMCDFLFKSLQWHLSVFLAVAIGRRKVCNLIKAIIFITVKVTDTCYG